MKEACSFLYRLRESDPHVFCLVYCGSLIRLFNNNVIVLLKLFKGLGFIDRQVVFRFRDFDRRLLVLTSSRYDSRVTDG